MAGLLTIEGSLETRTGLHIGDDSGAVGSSGADRSIVALPFRQNSSASQRGAPRTRGEERIPYGPGSALRGRLRMLMERALNTTAALALVEVARAGGAAVHLHTCHDPRCRVCRMWGTVGQGDRDRGGRLQVYPLIPLIPLDPTTADIEVKAETALDRATAAAVPRVIERTLAGAVFRLRIDILVDDPADVPEDFETLCWALALLEDDALGGGGARGAGAVRVRLTGLVVRDAKWQTHQIGWPKAVSPREALGKTAAVGAAVEKS